MTNFSLSLFTRCWSTLDFAGEEILVYDADKNNTGKHLCTGSIYWIHLMDSIGGLGPSPQSSDQCTNGALKQNMVLNLESSGSKWKAGVRSSTQAYIANGNTFTLLFACGRCVPHRSMFVQACALCGGHRCLLQLLFPLFLRQISHWSQSISIQLAELAGEVKGRPISASLTVGLLIHHIRLLHEC